MHTTNIDKWIGANLKQMRESYNISRAALGSKLNIDVQEVKRWEVGDERILPEAMFELAKFLQRPISDFFPKPVLAEADQFHLAHDDFQMLTDYIRLSESDNKRVRDFIETLI